MKRLHIMTPGRFFSPTVRRTVKRGLTFAEIIVGLFILFVAFVFVFRMFHLAIYYSGTVADDAIASILAERRIEEIRGWAYTSSAGVYNFNDPDWSAFNGTTNDPEYPKFSISTATEIILVPAPSALLGANKVLTSSARCVKVEVAWQGGAGSKKARLVSVIGEPSREAATINLVASKPSPITLGDSEQVDFIATVIDNSGYEIKDVTMRWYVLPITANGTVWRNNEMGTSATFCNYVLQLDGTRKPTTGTCKVYALARVGGREIIQYSEELNLNEL